MGRRGRRYPTFIPDPATGAWNKLSPETATVVLTKVAMIDGPDRNTVGKR